MKRRVSAALLLALAVVLMLVPAASAEDVYSERTLALARELLCPVCAGETVASSGSNLAREMRTIIEQKVQAGESDAQIKKYFVDRYGESVLADPPKSGFTLTLWWFPVGALALGALVVVAFLRERGRASGRAPAYTAPDNEADAELEEIAREVLAGDSDPTPGDSRRPDRGHEAVTA